MNKMTFSSKLLDACWYDDYDVLLIESMH